LPPKLFTSFSFQRVTVIKKLLFKLVFQLSIVRGMCLKFFIVRGRP